MKILYINACGMLLNWYLRKFHGVYNVLSVFVEVFRFNELNIHFEVFLETRAK